MIFFSLVIVHISPDNSNYFFPALLCHTQTKQLPPPILNMLDVFEALQKTFSKATSHKQ